MRPAVLARVAGPLGASELLLALVDSGCDHVLVPEWMVQVGVALDDHRVSTIRIAGASRRVKFAEATLELAHPQTEIGESSPNYIHSWTMLLGFVDWGQSDPPWLLILGQAGFFDQLTVTMSRLAQALTVSHRDDFDSRYPPTSANWAPDTAPRFKA
jgi:hypothetical protein